MATESSWLSREQTAQAMFVRDLAQLKSYVVNAEIAGLANAMDSFGAATLAFGSCELGIRRSERLTTVGVSREEARSLMERGLRSNERGLDALRAVRPFIDELEKTPVHKAERERWDAESKNIRDQWREQFAQVDVGAADAKHLVTMLDQCLGAIDGEGPAGLARYLRGHLDELDKVRRTPERGTWANSFPWWKIVAAAIWLGMTAISVWRAVTVGAPWYAFAMIAFIALVGVILLSLGC